MTLRAVADTHAIIWYLYDDPRLSPAARIFIEDAAAIGDHVGFSSIVFAEIIYLIERRRIHADSLSRLVAALDHPRAVLLELTFGRSVAMAVLEVDRGQVPELPDRVIAATARYFRVPLISRDRKIQLSGLQTIW